MSQFMSEVNVATSAALFLSQVGVFDLVFPSRSNSKRQHQQQNCSTTVDTMPNKRQKVSVETNGNCGIFDPSELTKVLKVLVQNPTEIDDGEKDIFAQSGPIAAAGVNFAEILDSIKPCEEGKVQISSPAMTPMHDELEYAFRVFDRDNDGFITAEELKLSMAQMGEQLTDLEIQCLMESANVESKISYEDFRAMMLADCDYDHNSLGVEEKKIKLDQIEEEKIEYIDLGSPYKVPWGRGSFENSEEFDEAAVDVEIELEIHPYDRFECVDKPRPPIIS